MASLGHSEPAHIQADELCSVIEHLMSPRLSVTDLGRLACTCKGLRQAVLRPPTTALQQAAAKALGSLHPAINSSAAAPLQEALRRQAAARRNLVAGVCSQRQIYGSSFHRRVESSSTLVGADDGVESPPREVWNRSCSCVSHKGGGNIEDLQWSADSSSTVTLTMEKQKTEWCEHELANGSDRTLLCLDKRLEGYAGFLSRHGSFLAVPSPQSNGSCRLSVISQEGQEVFSCCTNSPRLRVRSDRAWHWHPHQPDKLALVEKTSAASSRLRIEDISLRQSMLLGPVHIHELGIAAWEPLCELMAVRYSLKSMLYIGLVDTRTGLEVCKILLPYLSFRLGVTISVTGLVAVGQDCKVNVIDSTTKSRPFTLNLNADPDGQSELARYRFTTTAWSLDGHMLAIGMAFCMGEEGLYDDRVRVSWLGVYDTGSWDQLARFYFPDHDVVAIHWSADSTYVVVEAALKRFCEIGDIFLIDFLDPQKC